MKETQLNHKAVSVRQIQLILGDSFVQMTKFPENSIGSVVTDSPYGDLPHCF